MTSRPSQALQMAAAPTTASAPGRAAARQSATPRTGPAQAAHPAASADAATVALAFDNPKYDRPTAVSHGDSPTSATASANAEPATRPSSQRRPRPQRAALAALAAPSGAQASQANAP